ncbi:hypothetical protein [Bartonella massiliensis]|uniref:hypothetical protein n=1 Tax=Bartonella massiliensis TaxID=929795 RepID=UPI00115C19B6|nr:hypothetical protein [Bartonella massiliensis]
MVKWGRIPCFCGGQGHGVCGAGLWFPLGERGLGAYAGALWVLVEAYGYWWGQGGAYAKQGKCPKKRGVQKVGCAKKVRSIAYQDEESAFGKSVFL